MAGFLSLRRAKGETSHIPIRGCTRIADMIRHCWRKANILPDLPALPPPRISISSMLTDTASNPLVFTENLVTTALDDLASRGVLQAANRMTIEELLNPSDESINMNEATDEEIYRAVIDSKVQRENAAANNIGDNDVDDDAPIELPPSRHEALQAKTTIEKYVTCSHGRTLRTQVGEHSGRLCPFNSAHRGQKNESISAH